MFKFYSNLPIKVLHFTLILYVLTTQPRLIAQTCRLPFNIKIEKVGLNEVDISWIDPNIQPIGWEIELIEKGVVRTGQPNYPIFTQSRIQIIDLRPATSYTLYIRTVCSENTTSQWNVAIPFTTNIPIPSPCQINIPLKDNGVETLILETQKEGILGVDIFLQSVSLNIDHTWPADLKIELESPQGQRVVLSQHNGIGNINFGDSTDKTCSKNTTFDFNACTSIKESKPPFIGVFKPDGSIDAWKIDTLSQGKWKLIITDRAVQDVGILKYINLEFGRNLCQLPKEFYVDQVDQTSVKLAWGALNNCLSVKLNVFENDILITSFFVPCNIKEYVITQLKPNTEYTFSLQNVCNLDSESVPTCQISTKTTCAPVSEIENFDEKSLCEPSCSFPCKITESIWYNDTNDGDQDWAVHKGETDTDFTGPSSDVTTLGNYVYIESNPLLCEQNTPVVLQSACMDIFSNLSECDMTYYFHMYGNNIQDLKLEISKDGGDNWEILSTHFGNQGNQWRQQTVSLQPYTNQKGIFRFVGTTSNGTQGDIALDEITFYGSKKATSLNTYYRDHDSDGFGLDNEFIKICSEVPPLGYAANKGDCDDNNPNIHPGSPEVLCNGIDENCNGMQDDQPVDNPINVSPVIEHVSCKGLSNGAIELLISGGQNPYHVLWNDQREGAKIANLTEGIYQATITDNLGCIFKTAIIEVQATITLNIALLAISPASCLGKQDGAIEISHNDLFPPYTYKWSDGSTLKNLINQGVGNYSVTITDAHGCTNQSPNYVIPALPSTVTAIQFLRQPRCHNTMDGSIELTTSRGKSPYTYLWNNGHTTSKIDGLSAGTYRCTITDSANCKEEKEVLLSSPPELINTVLSTEDIKCHGENNGIIKTKTTGGTPPYTFLWNNFSFNSDDLINISAGIYTLTITDANVCKTTSIPIEIKSPEPIIAEVVEVIPSNCIGGKDGSILINVEGGVGDYSFIWSDNVAHSNFAQHLSSGFYNVVGYDANFCKFGVPVIHVPFFNIPLDIVLTLLKSNKCSDEKQGAISSQVNGGVAPFDYNWSNGVQYFSTNELDTLQHLGSSRYNVTITDFRGCVGISNEIDIQDIQPLSYKLLDIQDNICPSDTGGIINLQINGGTAPYTLIWNEGLYIGDSIRNLPVGTYHGFIYDNNNCRLPIQPIQLNALSNITATATIVNEMDKDGSICIVPQKGIPPYQLQWSNGSIDNCVTNLSSGVYQVTVTDALQCSYIGDYIIDKLNSVHTDISEKIILYPNPTIDLLTIESSSEIKSIHVYTLSNTTNMFFNVNQKTVSLNIGHLPSGIYFVKCSFDNGSHHLKFIKI